MTRYQPAISKASQKPASNANLVASGSYMPYTTKYHKQYVHEPIRESGNSHDWVIQLHTYMHRVFPRNAQLGLGPRIIFKDSVHLLLADIQEAESSQPKGQASEPLRALQNLKDPKFFWVIVLTSWVFLAHTGKGIPTQNLPVSPCTKDLAFGWSFPDFGSGSNFTWLCSSQDHEVFSKDSWSTYRILLGVILFSSLPRGTLMVRPLWFLHSLACAFEACEAWAACVHGSNVDQGSSLSHAFVARPEIWAKHNKICNFKKKRSHHIRCSGLKCSTYFHLERARGLKQWLEKAAFSQQTQHLSSERTIKSSSHHSEAAK